MTENLNNVRHERRDVRLSWVLAFVVTAIMIGAALLWGVWGIFRTAEHYEQREPVGRYAPRQSPGNELPRDPRLEQLNRIEGIDGVGAGRRERVNRDRLNRFGETDEDGFVHIPIADAIDLVVDKLPVRSQNDGDDYRARGLLDAGESNSGRMFRGSEP